jgi:hypothetical protein
MSCSDIRRKHAKTGGSGDGFKLCMERIPLHPLCGKLHYQSYLDSAPELIYSDHDHRPRRPVCVAVVFFVAKHELSSLITSFYV